MNISRTCAARAARSGVGGAPIVVSHDLHGNLTRARVEAADAIVGYQTNPHRDHARTGRKSGELLRAMVEEHLVPRVSWRSLPMILGGGKTIAFLAPMRAVFRRMRAAEKREVLTASTFMVHPWNDDPALGWATYAIGAEADAIADEHAEMCWARRHEQPPEFPSTSASLADIVIVKYVVPFLMLFLPYNRKSLFVLTHGANDFYAAVAIPFDGPVHP